MADYNKIFSDDLVAGAAIRDDQGRIISTTYLTEGDVDSTLGTRVSTLETKVSSLETTTTSLSNRVTTLETDLTTTKSSLATLTSTVNTHISDTTAALALKADKATTYSKDDVDQLISTIPKFAIEVVQTLPTQDISYTTLYLVPDSSSTTGQLYTEWIYIKGNPSPSGDHWERLGVQRIDLSNYYTKTEIDIMATTINSSIAGVATRVTSLETTATSLSSRVTTLETSKQDKLSTTQISAINTVVDLNLHSRTFTNWESEG